MKKEIDVALVGAITFGVIGYFIVILGICTMTVGFEYAFVGVKETGFITEIQELNRRGEIEYTVYVDYVHDGEQYEGYMYHYTDDMHVGKEISFKISKDVPSNIMLPEGDLPGGLAVTAFGAVFAGLATVNIIRSIKKYKKRRELITQGRVIYAIAEEVVLDYSVRVNGKYPFILCCVYEDEYTGVKFTFRSKEMWDDPTFLFPKGSQVPVYVNGRDYSEYYVDVDKVRQVGI